MIDASRPVLHLAVEVTRDAFWRAQHTTTGGHVVAAAGMSREHSLRELTDRLIDWYSYPRPLLDLVES